MSKKNWVTPELIIIVRNNPEEAVLQICKEHDVSQPGHPGQGNNNPCAQAGGSGNWCNNVGQS